MNFAIVLIFVHFVSILAIDSNANARDKRSTRDDWPSMSESWVKIGDDFRRRADSLREWMINRQRTQIPSFNPMRNMFDNMNDKFFQGFDPSVVLIDKGGEEEGQEERPESFGPFGPGFPFQFGSDRTKLWSFGDIFSAPKPWWKGPNICIEKKVIESKEITNNTKNEGLEVEDGGISINMNYHSFNHPILQSFNFQSTQCTESDTSYTCVSKILRGSENRTTIVRHQCCHGFKRNPKSGCTKVDLKNLIQTMKDLKLNRMLRLIEKMSFSKKLSEDNVTVFGLTDDSLIEYEDDNNKVENEVGTEVMSGPTPVRRRRELENMMSNMIGNHLVQGFIKTDDFDDELLITSLSPTKQSIRFNVYNTPKKVVTANCAPIVSANNYATNGMVHIIDKVIQNPTKTIGQMVESDTRFTVLKNLLEKTDLMTKLQDQSQHLTLFAPTNDAFLRLDRLYLERLLKGQSCVEQLLNHHIMANTLCMSAIQEYASVRTGTNQLIAIKRSGDTLEIDGIPIREADKLGTNGVIHVIDGVMASEKSQPISKYLQIHGMTEYLNLIKELGLLEEWDGLQNVSFFIPSVDSMRALSTKSREELKNKTKEMFANQVVRPQSDSCDWNSDQKLQTIGSNQLRVNVFGDVLDFGLRRVSTVQCSKIVEPDEEICGANVHIIDRFLMPSKDNLSQVLQSNENFSIIRQILNISAIEAELGSRTYTLLAPNDQTLLHQLSEHEINSLVKSRSEAEKFIKSHLFPEIICCSGVNSSPLFLSSQRIRNLEGSLISVHKSLNGRIRFGNARVSQCDLMTDNGVIHVINRVLEKRPSMISNLPFPFEIII